MRKASTLVGFSLFALAVMAGVPTAALAADPSGEAATTAAPAAEPPAQPVAPTAAPAPAATEEASNVAASAQPEPSAKRKLQVGIGFVPAALGKFKYNPDPSRTVTSDAAFAYGFSLSAGYEVLPNFVVGIAPQMLFNVKEKEPEIVSEDSGGVSQIDMLVRLAYEYPIVETIRVYAEALPGYSLIRNDAGSKGFVLAVGLGTSMDIADRYFLNIGAGYQIGFQKWSEGTNTFDTSTRYVRVLLGGGIRL